MPTHLGGDCEQTPSRSRRKNLRLQEEARSLRALTERPACFEIDPRDVRSSAPIGYGCRTQLITAYNCGSISSSRCQTTCTAMIEDQRDTNSNAWTSMKSDRGTTPDWWSQTESNRRPPACKAGALPTELWPLAVSPLGKDGGPGKI